MIRARRMSLVFTQHDNLFGLDSVTCSSPIKIKPPSTWLSIVQLQLRCSTYLLYHPLMRIRARRDKMRFAPVATVTGCLPTQCIETGSNMKCSPSPSPTASAVILSLSIPSPTASALIQSLDLPSRSISATSARRVHTTHLHVFHPVIARRVPAHIRQARVGAAPPQHHVSPIVPRDPAPSALYSLYGGCRSEPLRPAATSPSGHCDNGITLSYPFR